ncbi:helix-turn-helix domain-containing protein [Pseudoalteromonas sp. SaAl2]
MLNWINRIIPRDSGPLEVQGEDSKFGFQKHIPKIMEQSHWHGHIEINFLFNCSAEYLINGHYIDVPEGKMLIFWAAIPHQMTNFTGDGYMINIYIPLQAFLSWKLPHDFIELLLIGEVVLSDSLYPNDELITQMWGDDLIKNTPPLTMQVISEIRTRISRMALEKYKTYGFVERVVKEKGQAAIRGINHVQAMLAYIAEHYDEKINIEDVAGATGLHKNYAMKLFGRVMKVSIKHYVNQLRLQHAQALLVDTQEPVINIANKAGFGSVSRFYDMFQKELHMSPLEFRKTMLKH